MSDKDNFLEVSPFEVQDNDANKTLVRIIEHLMDEVSGLKDFIDDSRQEMIHVKGAVRGADGETSPQEEIEAVVKASAEATNNIIDAIEDMQQTIDTLPTSYRKAFEPSTTKIFEACTFQDLTGQRLTKVVRSLSHVEERVEVMLDHFAKSLGALRKITKSPSNSKFAADAIGEKKSTVETSDKSLMNGPQKDQPSQSEIDDIFKDL